MGRLSRIVFGISDDEAGFERRGFECRDERARRRLEQIGRTFLEGYHAALEFEGGELSARLNAVELSYRGFAFEGAGMALALLDMLTPWRRTRLKSFVEGEGAAHAYMVYVGAGWALARLKRDPARALKNYDSLLGWLAVDGYGFHEGYFKWQAHVARQERPRRLSGYARRAFDQGLGRSLWFVKGADVESVAATVMAFEEARRADLWSGVGLACTYAGGVDIIGVEVLRVLAGRYAPHLAQGAAFATKARLHAHNPASHTDDACRVLCGTSSLEAARVTDEALLNLPSDTDEPAYEIWRQRITHEFAPTKSTAAHTLGARASLPA